MKRINLKQNDMIYSNQVEQKLKQIMFPVALVGLFTDRFVDESGNVKKLSVNEYKAVINMRTTEIYSVVSNDYYLLSNEEALELGKKVFVKLFPFVEKKDLMLLNVSFSKRLTFSFIDLIHKSVKFDVWEQETWLPFLRITNSYNRTYAFTLELGFVKEISWAGIIFDKKTIEIKKVHSGPIDFNKIKADISTLQKVQAEFINYMLNLRRFLVPSKYILPLVLKALHLEYDFDSYFHPENSKPLNTFIIGRIEEYKKLRACSLRMFDNHSSNYGESAYAAFNAIIDLINSSNENSPFDNIANRTRQLNESLSNWIKDFTESIENRSFDFEKYLSKEIAAIERLNEII